MATPKAIADFRIKGLTTAPPTPFKPNGDVNYDAIPKIVDVIQKFGVPNAFVNGTTGESLHLTLEERKKTAQVWLDACKGKLNSVILHIGAGNYKDSQELARHAEEIGAPAIACVGPTYFKPTQTAEYVEYMRLVAEAAPKTPFYLYDIDFVTGIHCDVPDFFTKAKDVIPTLRGVKHTSPNFVSMNRIVADHGDRFQVMLGSNETYLEALAIGMDTTVLLFYTGNILNRLKAAFDKGDLTTASKEQAYTLQVLQVLNKNKLVGPASSKAILKILGVDAGQPRLPLAPIPEATFTQLQQDLTDIGFFTWGTKA